MVVDYDMIRMSAPRVNRAGIGELLATIEDWPSNAIREKVS